MHNVKTLEHPLVAHHLSVLRNRATEPVQFRETIYRLTFLLAYEATQNFKLKNIKVPTPIAETTGKSLQQRIGLVPILRAGLGMVDPVLSLIPDAEIWHLGYYRNEKTLQPVAYYKKLPESSPVDVALVVDPMLATGGSASAALSAVKQWGVREIKLLSVIAAPEGVEAISQKFPDVELYVCTVDEKLDESGYIVPGLGDAGDRIFNTLV